MNAYLETITAFLANMQSYPVAAAILTLVMFAVIAKITVWTLHRAIKSSFAKRDKKLQDKLIRILKPAIWIILLLLGVIVIIRWLKPLPQYQYATLGVLRTSTLLVFIYTLNRFMNNVFSFWRDTRGYEDQVLNQIEGFGKAFTIIVGLAILLTIWQIDLAPLLASAGILGIVVAIAAQDSLSNLFGGVSLFMDRPFKIGDYVVLETGERGKVTWLGMRSTRLLTRDDVQITVPNSIMAGTKIINESAPNPRYRIRIKVGVAYGTDLDLVEETLLGVTDSNPKLSSFPEPRVRFRQFGDSSLDIELLCWATQPQDRGIVVHQLSKAINKSFAEKKITIAFPQRDVHLHHLPTVDPKQVDRIDPKGNLEAR